MKDVKKLIEQVLDTVREKQSKHFDSILYKDEPILKTASQMDHFIPPKYREMRQLSASFDYYRDSEAALFYRQAKLMEAHTDDYEYRGEFIRYFPTYQSMNDQQLRGYFSWRTKVRRGEIQKTSLSFAFVYIYELLHQIGVTSDLEGFHALRRFWTAYREIDSHIDRYMGLWLHDYVIYYGLDPQLLDEISDIEFDRSLAVLTDPFSADTDTLFVAITNLSTYHFDHSKLYKLYAEDVRSVTCGVFRAMCAYYAKNRKNSYVEKLFGKRMEGPYLIFHSAVFHDSKRYEDYSYSVSDIHKYRCRQGKWRVEKHFGSRTPSKELGTLLRTVDAMMRRQFEVKPLLKQEPETKLIAGIIEAEIPRLLEEKRQAAARKIEIDRSKLQGIRVAAVTTRDKLIVEEPEEEAAFTAPPLAEPQAAPAKPEPIVDQSSAPSAASLPEELSGLDQNGRFLLTCLLEQRPYAEALKEQGILLSVLVDSINEALFDTFGDTVILFAGESPELIEDYTEELKGMLKL